MIYKKITQEELISMNFIQQKSPTCYKCQKPVDSFTEKKDLDVRTNIYIAKCHGSEERVELTEEFLINYSPEMGYAFETDEINNESLKGLDSEGKNVLRFLLNSK